MLTDLMTCVTRDKKKKEEKRQWLKRTSDQLIVKWNAVPHAIIYNNILQWAQHWHNMWWLVNVFFGGQ